MPKKSLTYKKIITPAFSQNNIPIVFASNKKYLPYLGVALHSLIKNSSPKYNYDLFVLHNARYNFTRFPTAFFTKKNVSLRFIPLNLTHPKINFAQYASHHWSPETFFRLLIPEIFACFNKVIYLDLDIIVLDDIAKLYHVPMRHYPLAATRNFPFITPRESKDEFYHYFRQILPQVEIKDYFCAAVLVFNLQFFPSDFSSLYLTAFHHLGHPRYQDQDILNLIFSQKVYFLAPEWNLIWYHFFPSLIHSMKDRQSRQALLAHQNRLHQARIIHFASNKKPWTYSQYHLASIWWQYACATPFYRFIIFRHLLAKFYLFFQSSLSQANSFIHLYGSLIKAKSLLALSHQPTAKKKHQAKIATLHAIIRRHRKLKLSLKN